jgi:hypothetical protein
MIVRQVVREGSAERSCCCRANDFFRILTEPEHNMIKQQQALIATEGVELIFTDPAIRRISEVAEEVNTLVDNIGARRLHTILERILEEISFNAPEEVTALIMLACVPPGVMSGVRRLGGTLFLVAAGAE